MRDEESWHSPVSSALRKAWRDEAAEPGMHPRDLCRVELALLLLGRIAPGRPAEDAYVLLSGYPFPDAAGLVSTEEQRTALAAARVLLWTIRRRRSWFQLLETYRGVPERLRAYDVPKGAPPRVLRPTVAADRTRVYEDALSALPPYRTHDFTLATAGRHSFLDRRRATSVTIPDELVFARAAGHDLAKGRAGDGAPLVITRAMLLETARWMDERERGSAEAGDWERRLDELHVAVRDASGRDFAERDDGGFVLAELLHMVGMVGAGKSTLMVLVAVWAARLPTPLRTTLVVGDVAEQLRLTALFDRLGIPAAPVLGSSTREDHVRRLHRRQAAQGKENLLDHDDDGFDLLSTACPVDALRGIEAAQPLRYADAPCVGLHPEQRNPVATSEEQPLLDLYRPSSRTGARPARDPDEGRVLRGKPHACPVWSRCPRHHAARRLVDARIWIANPASLVQSGVPKHLNDERLRYLELACTVGDIVIVDEADAVQLRLDGIFAPAATLVQPGPESWLDRIHTHKIAELTRSGRLPLTDRDVKQWNTAVGMSSLATDELYRLLISDGDLRDWVDVDYFSPWTLQEKLLAEWFGDARREGADNGVRDERELFENDEDDETGSGDDPAHVLADARRAALTAVFDGFRDDPLGVHGPHGEAIDGLVALAHDLIGTSSPTETRKRAMVLLRELLTDTPVRERTQDAAWADTACRRLEFALLLSILAKHLDRVAWLWPMVEAALRLDATGNELARRPPADYAPVVPESPMGNVLGFQFLPDERETDEDGRQSGTLRFFRCAGVGRELLTALATLGADPGKGRPGPHVLLLSGTSWAGMSSRYHVPAPVGAVLKPSARATEAVLGTAFATRWISDAHGRRIRLSGADPKVRPALAEALAMRLGSPGRGGTASPLEQELAHVRDPHRRRALLLVGSYREAARVATVLNSIPRWRGGVRLLIPDTADLDAGAGPDAGTDEPVGVLRRGDLASFGECGAEVLVAPLMAVERGHNILNFQRNAAFGLAMFLARPHPRPDDLALAVHSVNDWAARFSRGLPRVLSGDDGRTGPATFGELVTRAGGLDRAALDFRHEARQEWRRLLTRRYIRSRLPAWERQVFAWDQLVVLWQVIGRLVRGGVPARVVFVDAAFADAEVLDGVPAVASPDHGVPEGLLRDLLDILGPYFDGALAPERFPDPADPAVARLLYRPLHRALLTLRNHT
ncbi:hypothetical protein [Actinomadura gamaensis]|uniref:pPIWI-RE three-gene island domain-containing protein n=1 Tax=Actinomadura gamaensis TaxID=1763541 RepID=A0ABV9U279_9ACTN